MFNPFKKIQNFASTLKRHRSAPLLLEFVVSDYCNLNCKGCTHYSPLAPKEFESLEQLERNAAHLGRISSGGKDLDSVYIIGGEPLLYPGLPQAMNILRQYFPNCRILLFTNGLALPRMTEDFWASAHENNITAAITRYPVKFDYDAAIKLCADKGVACEVFGDRTLKDSFFRFGLDPTKSQNRHLSHFKCYNYGCISVIGDRIYPCSISGCAGHLNKAAGNIFTHEAGDYLEVEEVKSLKQIKRLRDRPVPFCAYCKMPPDTVPYGPSKRDISEWIDK